MPVSLEDLSSVKKVLHVEVPQEEVKRKVDEAYKDLNKKVKLKGFRPGKTPRNVLERLYKNDVAADVSQKLIQESLPDALRETELRVVGAPEIAPPDLDETAPFRYDATVEIAPDIPDIDYSGLQLKKNIYPVTDEEMDAQLRMLQKKVAEHKPVLEDRPIQKGDFAVIDYEATQNGVPFEPLGTSENHTVEVGRAAIAPEIDKALQGKKPGDVFNVRASFPHNYGNADLASQTVAFKIAVKEIREEVPPPLDDDLAKHFGPFEGLDALKDAIRANLRQGYDKRTRQELNEQIFAALLEKTDFEIPEALVQSELDAIVEDFRRQIESSNLSMEALGVTREAIAKDYRETAEALARRGLLLGKLINQLNLKVPEEELNDAYAEMARQAQKPVEQVKEHYKQNPDKHDYLKHALLEKRAIDLIVENSDIEEVEARPEQSEPEARAAEVEAEEKTETAAE
jgi:trigger factor